jgi:hypothetical protein
MDGVGEEYEWQKNEKVGGWSNYDQRVVEYPSGLEM